MERVGKQMDGWTSSRITRWLRGELSGCAKKLTLSEQAHAEKTSELSAGIIKKCLLCKAGYRASRGPNISKGEGGRITEMEVCDVIEDGLHNFDVRFCNSDKVVCMRKPDTRE